jgi:hypothetical protein
MSAAATTSGSEVESCSWSHSDSVPQDNKMHQKNVFGLVDVGEGKDDHSNTPTEHDSCDAQFVSQMTRSPTSVHAFDADPRPGQRRKFFDFDTDVPAKRYKAFNFDVEVPALPKPISRQSRTKPICTFLNYLGSRLPKVQAEEAQQRMLDLKSVLAPLAFLPICPRKLKHQVLKGSIRTAPPILQLLSMASFCQPTTLVVAHTASQSQKVDDLGGNVDDEP